MTTLPAVPTDRLPPSLLPHEEVALFQASEAGDGLYLSVTMTEAMAKQAGDALEASLAPCGDRYAGALVAWLVASRVNAKVDNPEAWSKAVRGVLAGAPADLAREAVERIIAERRFMPEAGDVTLALKANLDHRRALLTGARRLAESARVKAEWDAREAERAQTPAERREAHAARKMAEFKAFCAANPEPAGRVVLWPYTLDNPSPASRRIAEQLKAARTVPAEAEEE